MKTEFINHSGFIIEQDGCRVMCDPWLEGNVFLNGWQLLSPSKHDYGDFKNIDYIWFSHEHPDHFNPPNLNRIPVEVKKNITVLFQHTIDKRVLNYCKKAGFKDIVELLPGTWLRLAPDLEILCEHFKEGDSWICFRSKDTTILNTNDCGIRNKSEIIPLQKKIGRVDILLTQFSYAYWAGNKGETSYREQIAAEKLEGMKFQCDHFQPGVLIPMASYIWFCHEENFYLNDHINRPGKVFDFIKNTTTAEPVVLYNGESYELNVPHDSAASIRKYETDFFTYVKPENTQKNKPVGFTLLENEAKRFIDRMNAGSSLLLRKLLKPVLIYLSDLDTTCSLSLKEGLKQQHFSPGTADIELSSECLLFCFAYPYGSDTLQISGRFQKPAKGHFANFHNMFRIEQLKSRGINIGLKFLAGVLIRKILIRTGIYKP